MTSSNTAVAPATEKPPVSSRFTVGNLSLIHI